MGWFEILLILLFIVFPLIEQIASARRKKRLPQDEPPVEYEGGYEWQPPARPERPRAEPVEPAADGRFEDWGHWPGLEPEPQREEAPARIATLERDEAPEVWSREWEEPDAPLVRPMPLPEQITAARPVPVVVERVVLERGEVDRVREHQRFHDQYVRRPLAPPEKVQRGHASALSDALRQPGDLRRAIILTEVLGAPRAIRPLDEPLH
jgi:hypothetical protein